MYGLKVKPALIVYLTEGNDADIFHARGQMRLKLQRHQERNEKIYYDRNVYDFKLRKHMLTLDSLIAWD